MISSKATNLILLTNRVLETIAMRILTGAIEIFLNYLHKNLC